MHERAVWICLCDLGGQTCRPKGSHHSSQSSMLLLAVLCTHHNQFCQSQSAAVHTRFRSEVFVQLLCLSFPLLCTHVHIDLPCPVKHAFTSMSGTQILQRSSSPKIIQPQTLALPVVLAHRHHALSLVSTMYFA